MSAGEDNGRGSSKEGKVDNNENLKQASSRSMCIDGDSLPPTDQNSSSGSSGGGDKEPPKKPTDFRIGDEPEEDSSEDDCDDEDIAPDEISTAPEEIVKIDFEGKIFSKEKKNLENGQTSGIGYGKEIIIKQCSQQVVTTNRKCRGRPRKYPLETVVCSKSVEEPKDGNNKDLNFPSASTIKKESNLENGHINETGIDEDVKPTLEELTKNINQQMTKPIHRSRGRPRKFPLKADISGNPVQKKKYKKRKIKVYKATDMVRREREMKSKSVNEGKPKINLARQKYLESLKRKESTSWDKEVANTLQNVMTISKKSKKFKAVGRPRKRPLDDECEGFVKARNKKEKKVKLGVMAYPIVEIKKKSENDWDTVEAKYTVPGFCCNDCGAVYQSTAALRRHQNYECGKEPQFKCDECDYAAKHKGTLKSHIKNRHLPKNDLEDTLKKPRKPRKPRVLLIPRAPSPI